MFLCFLMPVGQGVSSSLSPRWLAGCVVGVIHGLLLKDADLMGGQCFHFTLPIRVVFLGRRKLHFAVVTIQTLLKCLLVVYFMDQPV